eukprot:CAMPEP_0198560046 /NCGR_PEP_ID=MMETSP1462-20131121/93338_1 /TAXON_ID=1333877 /ORGANISM="Brandtodinium nutriculum, Strain RCC3387" /LENGTH=131 /DNA_ID=CAMNT_0044290901 /DNA_START=12 /DNA_END=404 /DNA_ORIENTATION=-
MTWARAMTALADEPAIVYVTGCENVLDALLRQWDCALDGRLCVLERPGGTAPDTQGGDASHPSLRERLDDCLMEAEVSLVVLDGTSPAPDACGSPGPCFCEFEHEAIVTASELWYLWDLSAEGGEIPAGAL